MRIVLAFVVVLVFAVFSCPVSSQEKVAGKRATEVTGWVMLAVVRAERDPKFLWFKKKYVPGLLDSRDFVFPKPGDILKMNRLSRLYVVDFATRGFDGARISPADRQLRSDKDWTPFFVEPGEIVAVKQVEVSESLESSELRMVWVRILKR